MVSILMADSVCMFLTQMAPHNQFDCLSSWTPINFEAACALIDHFNGYFEAASSATHFLVIISAYVAVDSAV